MSDTLDPITGEPIVEDQGGDNEVISTLRAQLKDAKAAAKAAQAAKDQALADARTQLKRESEAQRLMDAAGYPGMVDVVLSQVEGEITADNAVQALEGLKLDVDREALVAALAGQPAPASTEAQSASSIAEQVSAVTSLGGQLSAAAENTQESNFESDLARTNSLQDIIALAEKHGFNDPS